MSAILPPIFGATALMLLFLMWRARKGSRQHSAAAGLGAVIAGLLAALPLMAPARDAGEDVRDYYRQSRTAPPQPPQWPRCRSLLHRHHGDKGVLGGLTPGGDGVG